MKFFETLKKLYIKIVTAFSQKVFYINGPETLPPPLSREEEADCD